MELKSKQAPNPAQKKQPKPIKPRSIKVYEEDDSLEVDVDEEVPMPAYLDTTKVSLTDDADYSPTNIYAGHTAEVTIVTRTPEKEVSVILAVYNEEGAMVSADVQTHSLPHTMNRLTFRDIQAQFAGEELCQIKVFLLDGSMNPITENEDQFLIKP